MADRDLNLVQMIAAFLLFCALGVAQAFETVSRAHFANLQYSLFTGLLYEDSNSVCFNDKDHPTNGFIENFPDSDDPYYELKLGSLTRTSVEANVSSSAIYYSIASKSMEQRVQLTGLLGQPDDLLFSVKIGKTPAGADGTYDIAINFKQTNCSQTFPTMIINNVTAFSKNITCPGGVTGNVSAWVTISYFVSYSCSATFTANTASPLPGIRVDWTYNLQPGSVFRALFPESGNNFPPEGPLNFRDLYQTLEYGIQFEEKAPATPATDLKLSQTVLVTNISYVDAGCIAITNGRCSQCAAEFNFVNGECICNKNGTIDVFREYPVQVPINDTATETSTYFQDICRPIGQGMDAAAASCETQIDFFLKRKVFLRINRSDTDSGVLNITVYSSDPALHTAAQGCANFSPILNLYLDYFARPWGIGRNSMSSPLLVNHKTDTSKTEYSVSLPLNDITNKLSRYCQTSYLDDSKTLYECQLWAVLGPGTKKTSQDYFFRLNFVITSSSARKPTYDAQVFNLNYTKSLFDSVFKSDANLRTRVFTYNKSDDTISSFPYDNRFVLNTFGRFEKNQIVRYSFDLVNLTMTGRYRISDWKKTSIITDAQGGNQNQPYLGETCNATFYNETTFYQTLVVDCLYSLKNNISVTFDIILTKRYPKVYPESITLTQVFMFEAYQNKEKIVLAGLSKTVTIILIVIILLLMTSVICYLAVKAGAADNIDLEEITKNVKEGVTKGVKKVKEAYKETKKTVKEAIKDEKKKTKELHQKLLDDEEESKEKKNKSKTGKGKDNSKEMKDKKKRKNDSDEEVIEDIIPESLKKNDISAIRPVKDKRSDSHEDIFEDTKKAKKATKIVLDSEEDDETPQKNLRGTKTESKPVTPITDPKLKSNMEDFKFDSQDKNDSSDEELKRKPKKKAK